MPLQRIEDWDKIDPPKKLAEIAVGSIANPSVKLDRDAASKAAKSGDNWHNNILALVASLVAKGNTDKEIHVLAAEHTLPGYTIEQTAVEVQKMIDGARSKGFDQNALKTTVSETLGLTLKKNGDPHPNVHNIFEVLSNSASWYSVFAFDEFVYRNKFIGTTPYVPANDQSCIPRDL